MKMKAFVRGFAFAVLASLLTTDGAHGQGLKMPLIFGNIVPFADEWGNHLKGSSATGIGDLVQIYRINSGFIQPPNIDGTPQPNYSPLPGGTAYIGHMVGSHLPDSGLFAISITSNQPPVGTRLFVRVFNQPTIAQSSFYGDSAEFSIQSGKDTYVVEISGANLPLDTADPDGDRLHNSWEKSLGTDPNNPDTDGDGMSDFDEWLAGTDPLDPNSLLRIEDLIPSLDAEMDIVWQTISGKCYFIEFSADLLPGPESFEPLHDVPFMATEQPISTMTMDTVDFGLFRVRLADCPE